MEAGKNVILQLTNSFYYWGGGDLMRTQCNRTVNNHRIMPAELVLAYVSYDLYFD